MTLLSRGMALFPALMLAVLAGCVGWVVVAPSWGGFVALLGVTYGLPLLCFRLLGLFYPVREGASRIDAPVYSPWWGGHQTQLIYEAVPQLEALLRLVPGLYSAWLRAWGSRVGRGVYWTPSVRITDRNLMDIGDGAIFGHGVECFAHVVVPRPSGLLLVVRRVRIGPSAFIGAQARLGPGAGVGRGAVLGAFCRMAPGALVAEGALVPAGSDVRNDGVEPNSGVAA